jgi:hypothetical protein
LRELHLGERDDLDQLRDAPLGLEKGHHVKIKLLLATCCGIATLVGTAYAVAASHRSHGGAAAPVQAAIGPWRALGAAGLQAHAVGLARAAGAGRMAEVAGVRATDGSYVGIVRDSSAGLRYAAVTANPGDTGASTHPLRSLADVPFIDGSLGLLTLEQTAAPDGSVGRIYGAGIVKPPATRAQLELVDGSVVSLPLVDLSPGFRGYAFVAAEPKQFPKAIQGMDARGKVVAQFAFDPNAHP